MIACTLGEGDLPARMAEWREFAAGSVTSVEMGPGPRVVRLHLRRGAAVLAAAASLRRREKECCSSTTSPWPAGC